ncbi:MAG: hypothetical protein CVV53_05240 [Spirochaetae bacterium HGW-Spirochaetae-9]|nr:MAG: hypothetical protein CVV53_05240 [Spirochaetae bacterium HGW-Spirochaetae-9]
MSPDASEEHAQDSGQPAEKPGPQSAEQEVAQPIEPRKGAQGRRKWLITLGMLLIVAVSGIVMFREGLFSPRPPAPDVAATFSGGRITVMDIHNHLALLAKQAGGQKPQASLELLRGVAEEMVADEIVRRWGKDRKAEKDENIAHLMSHVSEELNLEAWHTGMHEGGMGISESDIDAYYQANQTKYGERSLGEARTEIERTLKSQGEDRFVENYLAGLKNTADIRRNYEALDVPPPDQSEIAEYFEANRELFSRKEKLIFDEVRIDLPGADAEAAVSRIVSKVRGGERLAEAAKSEGQGVFFSEAVAIEGGGTEDTFAKQIAALEAGQTAEPFRYAGSFYVVTLISRETERRLNLTEAFEEARLGAWQEKQTAWFERNRDVALFSVGGNRLTAGDFWKEYCELPPDVANAYRGVKGMRELAERLLERYLVAEEASRDKKPQDDGRGEEARLRLLSEVMEKEEIDDKVVVTDEEIESYYRNNQKRFQVPPQSKVRRIKIKLETSDTGAKDSWRRADEAYNRLVPGPFKRAEDFTAIAREYDLDALEAEQGWNAEPVWTGEGRDFLSELRDHAYHTSILTIPVGKVGKPFEYEGVIYIVEVLERTKPEPIQLDSIKLMLREELAAKKHAELSQTLSRRLLKENKAVIYDRVLRSTIQDEKVQTDRATP